MTFKKNQYIHAEELLNSSDIFYGDSGHGHFRGKPRPFVLQDGMNNLYAPMRDDIMHYFDQNNITWWSGHSPTNHTLSSQIACLNHLFPIRNDRDAVLTIAKKADSQIVDVMIIETDSSLPAYIQFESVSDLDHLNESKSTRGSSCTSVDALIYARHADGHNILIPIEWKYVEQYWNDDKSAGTRGATRKNRYTDLINNSSQLISPIHDIYYYEPFYQLMRQTFWAEQLIANAGTEKIKADDYIHLHVIPSGNEVLLSKNH